MCIMCEGLFINYETIRRPRLRHRGGCSIITLGLHDLAKSNQHEHHLCLNVSVSVYLHFSDDGDALMPGRLQPE